MWLDEDSLWPGPQTWLLSLRLQLANTERKVAGILNRYLLECHCTNKVILEA